MTSNQPQVHTSTRGRVTALIIMCMFATGCGSTTSTPPADEAKTAGNQAQSETALSDGLLGHWKFDGDSSDSSSHAKHGQPIGAPRFGEGKIGQAIQLNGSNQCVEVPVLAADVTQFALVAWMYVDGMPSPQSFVSIYHNDGWEDGDVHLPFTSGDGTMDLGIKGNEPSMSVPSFKVIDMQKRWVHLAVTYDADETKQVRFYVDGQLAETFDIETAHPVRLGPGRIGGWDVEGRWFLGRLDEIYIYERALIGEEVKALFALGGEE